jgi:hypothetical protein
MKAVLYSYVRYYQVWCSRCVVDVWMVSTIGEWSQEHARLHVGVLFLCGGVDRWQGDNSTPREV